MLGGAHHVRRALVVKGPESDRNADNVHPRRGDLLEVVEADPAVPMIIQNLGSLLGKPLAECVLVDDSEALVNLLEYRRSDPSTTVNGLAASCRRRSLTVLGRAILQC